MIPLAVIPPPSMTPRHRTVGFMITDAPMRAAAQITVPMIQKPIPMMIFNSDLPSELSPVNDAGDDWSCGLLVMGSAN